MIGFFSIHSIYLKNLKKFLAFLGVLTGCFLMTVSEPLLAKTASASSPSPAGHAAVISGSFNAIDLKNKTRLLHTGDAFYTGDTLITGNNTTAQIKLTDGTVMALYPDTRIKIDQYVYQNNAKDDKNFISFIKGSFRTLTGLISKKNPEAYQVKTPVSVIGVRGTNYSAALHDDKLYVGVWEGDIYIKNDTGTLELGKDKPYAFGMVEGKHGVPLGLLTPPKELTDTCQKPLASSSKTEPHK